MSKRSLLPIFCTTLAAFSGCSALLEVDPEAASPRERKTARVLLLSWSRKGVQWLIDEHAKPMFTMPSQEVIPVKALVEDVDLPFMDTPSIMGERATATFTLQPGSIPTFPSCDKIKLKYDSYAKPFKPGQQVVFQFFSDGRFWGIEGFCF